MRFGALVVVCLLLSCKNAAPVADGGTIDLTVSGDRAVDRVQLRAFGPDGQVVELEFDPKGVDISKTPISGEVTPGATITSGKVMFVGFGLIGGQVVAGGSAIAVFEA